MSLALYEELTYHPCSFLLNKLFYELAFLTLLKLPLPMLTRYVHRTGPYCTFSDSMDAAITTLQIRHTGIHGPCDH